MPDVSVATIAGRYSGFFDGPIPGEGTLYLRVLGNYAGEFYSATNGAFKVIGRVALIDVDGTPTTLDASATLQGTGSLIASATTTFHAAATLTGVGTLSANAEVVSAAGTTFGLAGFNDDTPTLSTQAFSNPFIFWFELEPTEGAYDLSPIETALAAAATEGKKAIIRIAIANLSSQPTQASPDWLFAKPGIETYTLGSTVNPTPWNSVYQTEYQQLLTQIAATYDGDSRIEYIQCCLGGVYGEMYLGASNPAGWSIANQNAAIQFHVDAYNTTFPNTPKAAQVNSWSGADTSDADMLAYIVSLGWILQTNSPTGNSIIRGWFNDNELTCKIAIEAETGDAVLPGFQTKWEDMVAAWDVIDYSIFNVSSFNDGPTNTYIQNTVIPALRTDGPQPSGWFDGGLITNPSFETDTTGWASGGGTNTLERVSAASEGIPPKFGDFVGKCTFQDNNNFAQFALTVTDVVHNCGIWVYIPTAYDGTDLELIMAAFTGAANNIIDADMGIRDEWQFLDMQGFNPDAGDLSGLFRMRDNDATVNATPGVFFYIDGASVRPS